MARKPRAAKTAAPKDEAENKTNLLTGREGDKVVKRISLASVMAEKPTFTAFSVWLIGDTPLIVHAWSEKARREMLQKQVGAPKAGKEARNPEADFKSSLYRMGADRYGFPVTGLKNAVLSASHKDKGLARSTVQAALWLDAEMVRIGPALAGAVCDMPLVQVYGSEPEMREDMVKIGSGLQRVASLAYRAQFTQWAIRITGRFSNAAMNEAQLAFLLSEAGTSYGLGEWRNERRGMFGAFHVANSAEEASWERYALGKGPLPKPLGSLQLVAE